MNSEKIFLMDLYHKLKTQCDAVKDRVTLIDSQIVAEQREEQRSITELPQKNYEHITKI